MFELPDAKRVRREDLFDTDSVRHSSPEEDEEYKASIEAKLREKLSNILTVDFGQDQQQQETCGGVKQQEEEDPKAAAEPEFEFRLFSTGPTQKVLLPPAENQKPGSDENSGGIVEPRPLSYYVRGEPSPEQKAQFASAAIDASEILKGARQRAWGLELPWRVVKLTVSSSSDKKADDKPAGGHGVPGASGTKKGKLGKKGRIAGRIKQKAALELEKQKMTKEEHLKEKKKRLNREKKLKRRQKEREKKLAASAGGGGDGSQQGQADGDSMSEGED